MWNDMNNTENAMNNAAPRARSADGFELEFPPQRNRLSVRPEVQSIYKNVKMSKQFSGLTWESDSEGMCKLKNKNLCIFLCQKNKILMNLCIHRVFISW